MSIVRRKRSEHYTVVPNHIWDDEWISFEAKSLLCYLLSRPDSWQIRIEHLKKATGFGRDKCYKLIAELCDRGYAKRETMTDKAGRFTGQETVIYDEVANDIEPFPDLPDAGNTVSGKSGDIVSTERSTSTENTMSPDGDSERFEELWKSFPRTGFPSKAKARDAWNKLSVEDRSLCERGLREYQKWFAAEVKRRPDTPAVHMATFINQRRFDGVTEIKPDAKEHDPQTLWRSRMAYWQRNDGHWLPDWGTPPGITGCEVPAEIQREFVQ